ncbi:hypothetical protein KI659_00060 [Litoribacter alkaliphilus]|uniref:Uncharacterized protein n=1 Tax=Litoribacter ruber TaxID=702568 RepID=A0AAP2G0I2_9BACT|nr:hypothetical protein [Litoribacter alkaliphilus]MBS9522397.1 hypothetical protein [Litoribacter alkaliphilus]
MENVSKSEYLSALDIVERYHKQLHAQIDFLSCHKTPIEDWFANLPEEPSGRLKNILLHNPPFEYLEDITKFQFLRQRNAGEVTWTEFEKLKNLSRKE